MILQGRRGGQTVLPPLNLLTAFQPYAFQVCLSHNITSQCTQIAIPSCMLANYSIPYYTQPCSAPSPNKIEGDVLKSPSDRPSLFLTLQPNSGTSYISPLITEQLQIGSLKKDAILITPVGLCYSLPYCNIYPR